MSNKMALDALTAAREWLDGWASAEPYIGQLDAAIAALQAEPQHEAEIVRNLLWDEHPECCGCPVVGAEYMGQQELVCCGQPEPALLNDRQIVATLRAKFPALPATPPKD